MKKIALILGVAGLAVAANAQSFSVSMAGQNMTNAANGLDNAEVGDVIRVELVVTGGSADTGFARVRTHVSASDGASDWNISEGNFNAGELGRRFRNAIADKPAGSPNAGNGEFGPVATTDGSRLEIVSPAARAGAPIDFVNSAVPGIIGAPLTTMTDGLVYYRFEFTFAGGVAALNYSETVTGNFYDGDQAIQGTEVTYDKVLDGFGNALTVVPAPASMALLGLGGLVAARRRRA